MIVLRWISNFYTIDISIKFLVSYSVTILSCMGIFLSQPGASSFHSRAFEIIFSESSWREIGHSLSVSGFLPKLDAAGVNMYLGVKVDIGFRESKSYHEVRMIYKSLLYNERPFYKILFRSLLESSIRYPYNHCPLSIWSFVRLFMIRTRLIYCSSFFASSSHTYYHSSLQRIPLERSNESWPCKWDGHTSRHNINDNMY